MESVKWVRSLAPYGIHLICVDKLLVPVISVQL